MTEEVRLPTLINPTLINAWDALDTVLRLGTGREEVPATVHAPTSDRTKVYGGKDKLPESTWHRALPTAVPGHRSMASIAYVGTVAINVRARTVEFDGKIDLFPAFEMHGIANGGAGTIMFNTMPLPGKDPWILARRGQSYAERLGDDLAMLRLWLPPLLLHATAHSSKSAWSHKKPIGE